MTSLRSTPTTVSPAAAAASSAMVPAVSVTTIPLTATVKREDEGAGGANEEIKVSSPSDSSGSESEITHQPTHSHGVHVKEWKGDGQRGSWVSVSVYRDDKISNSATRNPNPPNEYQSQNSNWTRRQRTWAGGTWEEKGQEEEQEG